MLGNPTRSSGKCVLQFPSTHQLSDEIKHIMRLSGCDLKCTLSNSLTIKCAKKMRIHRFLQNSLLIKFDSRNISQTSTLTCCFESWDLFQLSVRFLCEGSRDILRVWDLMCTTLYNLLGMHQLPLMLALSRYACIHPNAPCMSWSMSMTLKEGWLHTWTKPLCC